MRRMFQGGARVARDQRLDAEPDHLRQVVIAGILAARHQTAGDRPALSLIDALQRRGQVQPHDGGGVLACHSRERLERVETRLAILGQQLDGPRADVFVAITQCLCQRCGRPAAGHVQRPHRAKPPVGIRVRGEDLLKPLVSIVLQRAFRRTMLQDHAPAPCVPVARVRLQLHELGIAHPTQVRVASVPGLRQRLLGRDAINPASFLMQNILTADVSVMPVEDVESAIGPDLEAEPNPLRVVGQQEIVAVPRGEAGSRALEDVREHAMFVNVRHEDAADLRLRKRVRHVHPRAAVGRAMPVIGDRLNVAVDVRIEVLPPLAVIDASGITCQRCGITHALIRSCPLAS